jgi:hypothetical protein
MARGRDTPSDLADAARVAGVAGGTTPPMHDDGYRTAV